MRLFRKGALVLVAAGALAGATAASSANGVSAASQTYSLAQVGEFGGEPSIVSDGAGVLYDSTPSGLKAGDTTSGSKVGDPPIYRSTDAGATWHQIQPAAHTSGDTCLGIDQANALYFCNLADMANSVAPLQADSYKSTVANTCVASCAWLHGDAVVPIPAACGTSCSEFGVDRQWEDGWVPPASGTWCMNGAAVPASCAVLMYHDFYGPSSIWVNVSKDGGATFGPQINVLANFDPAASPVQVAAAHADSLCNTVPAGVKIDKAGKHPGRMYAAWIAADPAQNLSGCNVSMAQSFHNLIVAWSDNGGTTWFPQVAFDAGVGHDASSPFAAFTLDNQGNPYFGFTNNLNANPATCSFPNNPQTASCEYDMYVVWSKDAGTTWQPGNGAGSGVAPVPGSASSAFKVNYNTDTGTHIFPAIAAGDPGQVDVAYLETPTVVPTDPNGKEHPGGCISSSASTCKSTAPWYLSASQSTDLLLPGGAANQNPTWTASTPTHITSTPMHVGDICNLGIACIGAVGSDRSLLDFIQETIDPAGCAHIAYADNNPASPNNSHMMAANQTGGCLAISAPTGIAEVPLIALLPAGAVIALAAGELIRRRRKSSLALA